jgi:hypothetical protein
MNPQQDIRRHPDGSVDLDFYHRRAHRIRAKARREFVAAHAASVTKVVVAAVVIATAFHLVPARDGAGWTGGIAHDRSSASGYATAWATVLRR